MRVAASRVVAAATLLLGLTLTGCTSASTGSGHVALAAIPLLAADLPDGWMATPADDSGSDDTDAQIAACTGARDTSADRTGREVSPDFSMGNLQVSSDAASFGSETSVDADAQVLQNPKTEACFRDALQKEFQKSAGQVTINSGSVQITSGSGGGPKNLIGSVDGHFDAIAGTQEFTVFVHAAFIVGPKIEANVTFTSLGEAFDADLRDKLVDAVAARAANG